MNYLNTHDTSVLYSKVRNDRIYVDKSMLIDKISEVIDTSNRYICVTRPRRFGKSVNLHMLGAYYTKGQDNNLLFQGLKICRTEGYGRHLNNHNVVFIDFSRMSYGCKTYEEYMGSIYEKLKQDMLEKYPFMKGKNYSNIDEMFRDGGEAFIFLLDEWDSIFYKDFMTEKDKNSYLGFLKNLLKDQPYVELAYWYDGYYTMTGDRLFNPRSVAKALMRGVCLNYWTETGPMNEIADCIEHNTDAVREDIVKMAAGIPVEAELQGYSVMELELNSRDEILSAMVVYGFLSYHDGYLRIPNHELMEKYQRVLARESMGEVKEMRGCVEAN